MIRAISSKSCIEEPVQRGLGAQEIYIHNDNLQIIIYKYMHGCVFVLHVHAQVLSDNGLKVCKITKQIMKFA